MQGFMDRTLSIYLILTIFAAHFGSLWTYYYSDPVDPPVQPPPGLPYPRYCIPRIVEKKFVLHRPPILKKVPIIKEIIKRVYIPVKIPMRVYVPIASSSTTSTTTVPSTTKLPLSSIYSDDPNRRLLPKSTKVPRLNSHHYYVHHHLYHPDRHRPKLYESSSNTNYYIRPPHPLRRPQYSFRNPKYLDEPDLDSDNYYHDNLFQRQYPSYNSFRFPSFSSSESFPKKNITLVNSKSALLLDNDEPEDSEFGSTLIQPRTDRSRSSSPWLIDKPTKIKTLTKPRTGTKSGFRKIPLKPITKLRPSNHRGGSTSKSKWSKKKRHYYKKFRRINRKKLLNSPDNKDNSADSSGDSGTGSSDGTTDEEDSGDDYDGDYGDDGDDDNNNDYLDENNDYNGPEYTNTPPSTHSDRARNNKQNTNNNNNNQDYAVRNHNHNNNNNQRPYSSTRSRNQNNRKVTRRQKEYNNFEAKLIQFILENTDLVSSLVSKQNLARCMLQCATSLVDANDSAAVDAAAITGAAMTSYGMSGNFDQNKAIVYGLKQSAPVPVTFQYHPGNTADPIHQENNQIVMDPITSTVHAPILPHPGNYADPVPLQLPAPPVPQQITYVQNAFSLPSFPGSKSLPAQWIPHPTNPALDQQTLSELDQQQQSQNHLLEQSIIQNQNQIVDNPSVSNLYASLFTTSTPLIQDLSTNPIFIQSTLDNQFETGQNPSEYGTSQFPHRIPRHYLSVNSRSAAVQAQNPMSLLVQDNIGQYNNNNNNFDPNSKDIVAGSNHNIPSNGGINRPISLVPIQQQQQVKSAKLRSNQRTASRKMSVANSHNRAPLPILWPPFRSTSTTMAGAAPPLLASLNLTPKAYQSLKETFGKKTKFKKILVNVDSVNIPNNNNNNQNGGKIQRI